MQRFFMQIFLSLCSLLVFISSFAQVTSYHFDNYSSRDGLPSSEVYSVMRDRDNYLWFATDHGVCRYDGYSFQKIPLPDNTVFHIRQDSTGVIWFGTYTGQLFYIKNEIVFPYWYNHIILKKFKNQIITDFLLTADSTVYISFMTGDEVSIDAKGRSTVRTSQKVTFSVRQIGSDFFTSIYNSGKYLKAPAIVEIVTASYQARSTLNTDILWSRKHRAIRSSNGSLIAFAGHYLFLVNQRGELNIQQLPFDLLSIAEDRDGDLWVGCVGNGVIRMSRENEKKYTIREKHLEGFSITEIAQDHEGGIWFTSLEKGVFYLRSKYLYFLSPREKGFDYRISSLASVGDSLLLIGTKGRGVYGYDPRNKTFSYASRTGEFNNMYYDSETGRVIVLGSEFGSHSSQQALKQKLLGLSFLVMEGNSNLLKRSRDKYLFGRHSGAFFLDGKTGNITQLNDELFRVSWLQKDEKENILVANQYGLWKFRENKFYPYDRTKPLLNKRITCMQFFRDKILCLGTRGDGLLVRIKDSICQVGEEQGLVNNNIRKILVSDDAILLATNKGLSKIVLHSLDPLQYTIHNLGYGEGLFVSEVNDICRLGGLLYIASDIGLAFVDENQVLKEVLDQRLPFHFTQIKINDHPFDQQPEYSLNYKQRDITIAYTALSFRDPSGTRYRYRILGMDTSWIYTSAREIRLTSMPYGDFTIGFQAVSRSGKWISDLRSIRFSIRPPLWQRRWFLLLSAITVAALLSWWIRNKISSIKKREREKTIYNTRMAEMEIRSLRAQMNPHFTFNVMQSIQYYITHHDFDSAQRYLSKFSKLMRRVLDNSRFAYISLFDEIETLTDYLDLEKLRFENELEYSIQLQAGLDQHMIKIPTMLIQPYVENAIKHGLSSQKNNPRIAILIHMKDGYLIAEIIDNGIGRQKAAALADAQDQKHVSAGTSLVAERIEAFNKYYGYGLRSETIDLYDDQQQATGTRVVLTIPIYHSHDKSIIG